MRQFSVAASPFLSPSFLVQKAELTRTKWKEEIPESSTGFCFD
jgi:hypothetical protein